MRALVLSIFLYACESWTLTAELQRKILTTEMRCYRAVLGISYLDHVTNENIRNRIKIYIQNYEDLLSTVNKRKLQWYGHVTRSDGLSKIILQGTVEGKRRRGRQKKKWADNIEEWTGKTFAETQAIAHDRDKWRRLIRDSILRCPHDSSLS